MRAGLLRNRVTVQSLAVAQNEFNEEIETWSDLATVWARVQPMPGREFFAGSETMDQQPVVFTFRKRGGITLDEKTRRLVWDSKNYDITSISDVAGRGRDWEVVGVNRE